MFNRPQPLNRVTTIALVSTVANQQLIYVPEATFWVITSCAIWNGDTVDRQCFILAHSPAPELRQMIALFPTANVVSGTEGQAPLAANPWKEIVLDEGCLLRCGWAAGAASAGGIGYTVFMGRAYSKKQSIIRQPGSLDLMVQGSG